MMISSPSSPTSLDPVFPVSAGALEWVGGPKRSHRQSRFRALGCSRTYGFSEKGASQPPSCSMVTFPGRGLGGPGVAEEVSPAAPFPEGLAGHSAGVGVSLCRV